MFLEVSKEVLEKVRGEIGLNEQQVREATDDPKCWIQLQPHLAKEIDEFHKDTINSSTPVVGRGA
jgi:uncharacterized protein (DUF2126 family)